MSLLKNIIPIPILIPHGSNPNFPPIRFQFVPGSFTASLTSSYSEANSLNRSDPIIQFTKGEAETFTFEARLFSQHLFHEVNSSLEVLKRAVRRDEVLRRPPVWYFIWGSAVQETVVIESLGGIKYGDLRPDGLIRDVTMSITLKKYVAYDIVLTDVNKPETDSFFKRIISSGLFWEGLAFITYGTALLGTVLAYLNRTPTPVPGQTVSMPSRDQMAQKQLAPASPPMKRNNKALAARNNTFQKRNAKVKQSAVVVR